MKQKRLLNFMPALILGLFLIVGVNTGVNAQSTYTWINTLRFNASAYLTTYNWDDVPDRPAELNSTDSLLFTAQQDADRSLIGFYNVYVDDVFVDTYTPEAGVIYKTSGPAWAKVSQNAANIYIYNRHCVTCNEAENGKIDVTVTSAEGTNVDLNSVIKGDLVTIKVDPDDGYMVDSLTAKDADGNDITMTAGKFTMPAATDVTISATFKKISDGTTIVAEIGGTTYTSLQDAFNSAQEGQTIKLINDFDIDTPVILKGDQKKNITLDLNGHTVVYNCLNDNNDLNSSVPNLRAAIILTYGEGLTVMDSSESQNGTILTKDMRTDSDSCEAYCIYNFKGKFTLKSGNIIVNDVLHHKYSYAYAIGYYTTFAYSTSHITIDGGNVSATAFSDATAIYENKTDFNGTMGYIDINGGTVSSDCTGLSTTIYCSVSTKLNITGGFISSSGQVTSTINVDKTECTITGGSLSANGMISSLIAPDSSSTVVISGGKFSSAEVSQYLATGYMIMRGSDETCPFFVQRNSDPKPPTSSETTTQATSETTNTAAVSSVKQILIVKGTAKKKSISLKWNSVKGASCYSVYFAGTGKEYKQVTKTEATAYVNKGLKKGKGYKAYVAAYDANGQLLAKSPAIHMTTLKGKSANATKVSLNKSKFSLAAGKSAVLKGKIAKKDSKKALYGKTHTVSAIRYYSSDEAVASVSAKGKITAKQAGTCYIYAVAPSGAYKKATVTVK